MGLNVAILFGKALVRALPVVSRTESDISAVNRNPFCGV